jgi:hypothetical protein
MTKPKYLTGDKAAINEFIDRFDVGWLILKLRSHNLTHH